MIQIDLTTKAMTEAFVEAAGAIGDMTPLMADIGEYLVESTKQRFATSTAPDGSTWKKRSQTTRDAYARRKDRPKGGPLVGVTRALSTTIAYEHAADHVDWGSNMIYAAVMQFGAEQGEFGARIGKDKNGRDYFMTIPWGDIPARPYLGVSTDDETAIIDIVEEYLGDILR